MNIEDMEPEDDLPDWLKELGKMQPESPFINELLSNLKVRQPFQFPFGGGSLSVGPYVPPPNFNRNILVPHYPRRKSSIIYTESDRVIEIRNFKQLKRLADTLGLNMIEVMRSNVMKFSRLFWKHKDIRLPIWEEEAVSDEKEFFKKCKEENLLPHTEGNNIVFYYSNIHGERFVTELWKITWSMETLEYTHQLIDTYDEREDPEFQKLFQDI